MTDTKVYHNTRKAADMALAKRLISRASHRAVHEGRITVAQAKVLGRDRGPGAPTSRGSSVAATEGPERAGAEHSSREQPQEGTGTPPEPTSRISKDDTTQECWCGCGSWTSPGRRFRPGHDQRAKGIINRAVAASKTDELSNRLRDYGRERRLI